MVKLSDFQIAFENWIIYDTWNYFNNQLPIVYYLVLLRGKWILKGGVYFGYSIMKGTKG